MTRKKKKADDVLVIKPFTVADFIPKFDPIALDDDGNDVPVKLGKGDKFLPESGLPVEVAAWMGYIKYLVDILGPIEGWADLLNDAKTGFDDAVAAVLKDAIPLADHEAEMDLRVLKTTRDKQVTAAKKDALQDSTPNDEVDLLVDAAVQKATKNLFTKGQLADEVTAALDGMVSEDDMAAAVAVVEKKMSRMVSKADAKKNQDTAVADALENIDPKTLDLDTAVAAILEQTGADVSSIVGSKPASKKPDRSAKKTQVTKSDSQAAPAPKMKKTRSVTDWMNQTKK